MKVVVCGAGQVGFNIARHLANEQNDVTVIDRSEKLIAKIRSSLDVQAVVGYASHPDILEQAGCGDADMIIAVTLHDEVNMVACQVAHSLFNVPTKIARVRSQKYLSSHWRDLFSRDNMPIDVIISPEIEVARAAIRRLEVPGAYDMVPFVDDHIRVVGVRLEEDCPVVDTPLRQLTELFPDLNIVVCGIMRDGKMIIPTGDDQMLEGDRVYFVAEKDHVRRAMVVFGHEEEAARNVVIIGGGNIGEFIAKEIVDSGSSIQIKIIENNEKRATEIAENVHSAVVINGDALDLEIQKEANVRGAETVIAVTNDDKVNVLSSLLSKQIGCPRAITLVNNTDLGQLINTVGIDTFIDPRLTTVSSILQHIRKGRIRNLQALAAGAAEVLEAIALETSPLVGKPLRDVKLPAGILIGSVVRGDEVIVPRGGTVIKADDIVIIFARSDMIRKVEELFSVRLEYF